MTTNQISQEIEKNKLTLNSQFSFENLTDGALELRIIDKCEIISSATEDEQDGTDEEFHPTEAWVYASKGNVEEYFVSFKNFLWQRQSVIEAGVLLGALREQYKVGDINSRLAA